MVVYDLETFNANRAVPDAFGLYKLSKIPSKFYDDITQREKCTNDCVDFKVNNCINDIREHIFEFKGDAKRIIIKSV